MKTALIVVDYQNDFVCGSLGFEGAANIDSNICRHIDHTRKEGGDVIFTYDTHGGNYLDTNEGRHLPVMHCIRDTDGWSLFGETGKMVDSNSIGFEKNSFGSLELAEFLRAKKYDRVTLVGLVSNICVLSAAVLAKAALPEAEIIVDSNATASFDSELHDSTMQILISLHVTVI